MNFTEALRRMATQERGKMLDWQRWARWYVTHEQAWWSWMATSRAAECEARAQIYEDWAKALSFPGGPVHVDYIRYGCRREALV